MESKVTLVYGQMNEPPGEREVEREGGRLVVEREGEAEAEGEAEGRGGEAGG